jgi:hypothetical protein
MKNWLIRTKTNFILGPVSRDKLLELIETGSLTEEDELCSGNGYWFYLREQKLLNHYLIENNKQDYNPVSEALNEKKARTASNKNENMLSDDVTIIMKPK